MKMPDTVSPVEVVGTVLVTVGLLLNLARLVATVRTLRQLHRYALNGVRTILARGDVVRAATHTGVLLLFMTIGLLAMLTPDPIEDDIHILWIGIVALFVSSALLCLSLYDMREWRIIRRYLAERRAAPDPEKQDA